MINKNSVLQAIKLMSDAMQANYNESETRRRLEVIFSSVLGYDLFKHISAEDAISGPGAGEFVDYSIKVANDTKPDILVEVKRVGLSLSQRFLKQTISYAVNSGCEWSILTNGCQWQVYHIEFSNIEMIDSWDLLVDDIDRICEGFEIISLDSIKHNRLQKLWIKMSALTTRNLLEELFSESPLRIIRRELRRKTNAKLTKEDIINSLKNLLNDDTLAELRNIDLSQSGKDIS